MFRWSTMWRAGLATALACILGVASPVLAAPPAHPKLDKPLNERARQGGKSRAIVILQPGADVSADVLRLGGKNGRRLSLVNGMVVELPNVQLRKLADHPAVASIHWDRPTGGTLNRTAVTVGARAVQQTMGLKGAGVGVAVIDSGITSWHNDLGYSGSSSSVQMTGGQRVARFVDFVNGRTNPYDDHGHGTHVSGIIAGNGHNSRGAHAGIAPEAHLVSLKVLDQRGRGVISNVIAALEWAIANRAAHNIRVINLSVGAAVTESYRTDPLTLAAKRAVDAGMVVVVAAGNLGKNAQGQTQYGGITSPANAPWVLTVGAYSHEGTVKRPDDVVAAYSSRGPTAIDYTAKPDLVAPGTGTISLSDPTSTLYQTKSAYLVNGTVSVGYKPYLSLTGTSMAAPVVAGTVALMYEANPALTPNLVKAVLQYTAQVYPGYNALTQGAGFLNTKGAVDLARHFRTAKVGQRYLSNKAWSRQIIWGNHRLSGGVLKPKANAWHVGVIWGASDNGEGDNIVWGTRCDSRDECDNIVWGTSQEEDNIVWGTASGEEDNIVWGTYRDEEDNIVWGTGAEGEDDNIVWGTDCDNADCDNIVWGTSYEGAEGDNIVWGTAEEEDNIVWGTSGEVDNIVWGTSSEEDNVTWGNAHEDGPLYEDPDGEPSEYDMTEWDVMFTVTEEMAPAEDTSDSPPGTTQEPMMSPSSSNAIEEQPPMSMEGGL